LLNLIGNFLPRGIKEKFYINNHNEFVFIAFRRFGENI
jgi:hypothetical protein